MKKYLINLFYSSLMFSVILLSLVFFLATSTPGLYLVLKGVQWLLPGTIEVKGLKGRLIDDLSCKRLRYEDKDLAFTIEDVSLHWKLKHLLHHHLDAQSLSAKKLVINRKHPTPPPPVPHLPFPITLDHLSLETLEIKTQNEPFILTRLKANHLFLNKKAWGIRALSIYHQTHRFNLHVNGQTIFPYQESLSFNAVLKEPEATTRIHVNMEGNVNHYTLNGQITTPDVIHIQGESRQGHLELHANWAQFSTPFLRALSFQAGDAAFEGTLLDFTLKAKSDVASPLKGHLSLLMRHQEAKSEATLHLDDADSNIFATLSKDHTAIKGEVLAKIARLAGPVALKDIDMQLKLQAKTLDNPTLHLMANGMLDNARFIAKGHYQDKRAALVLEAGQNTLQLEGSAPYHWQLRAALHEPSIFHQRLQGLKTHIELNARTTDQNHGEGRLTLAKGEYHPPHANASALTFNGGQATFKLTPQALTSAGRFEISPAQTLQHTLTIQNIALNTLAEPHPITAEVQFQVGDLSFLETLFKWISSPTGKLITKLNVNGTTHAPLISGELKLIDASAKLMKLGLTLSAVEALLTTHDNLWQLTGLLKSNNVPLHLKGEGSMFPIGGQILLTGQDVPIMDLPQYQFYATPNLKLLLSPEALGLEGEVIFPKALIKPRAFNNGVNLPDDVKIVHEQQPETGFPLQLNLTLIAGEHVKINSKGLKGRLTGEVHLKSGPQKTINALGELSIVNGRYHAFGQKLIIDHGELVYTGGNIDNPGLQIRAIRRFNNLNQQLSGSNQLFDFNTDNLQNIDFGDKMTVGIEVSGRLSAPKIKLFSIPANLSQADILSMLVLGRPSASASQAGGQLLMTAISSMNLEDGTGGVQLLSQLKQSTGIDFDVQNNPSFNQQTRQVGDNTSFVLSKSITKRLYLSYNIGLLGADNNVLTIRYLLNKFFSVQVNTSDQGSGIDLLYTHSKDLSHDPS